MSHMVDLAGPRYDPVFHEPPNFLKEFETQVNTRGLQGSFGNYPWNVTLKWL